MKNEFYKSSIFIVAASMLFSFFLPWVSMGPFSISGYEIPKIVNSFGAIAEKVIGAGGISTFIPYLVYLVPILSGLLLFIKYKELFQFMYPVKIALAIVNIFILIKVIFNLGFSSIGIGLWILLASSIYLIYLIIDKYNGLSDQEKNDLKEKAKLKGVSEKTKKMTLISVVGGIVLICVVSFFNKNSYEKTLSALDDRNWEELNYNYEKALEEVSNLELELNYDEKKKLDMAYVLSNKLSGYDKFEEKYNSLTEKSKAKYFELEEEITALPDLNKKPNNLEVLGFDTEDIYSHANLFYNTYNVDFLEALLPSDLISKIKNKEIKVEKYYLTSEYPRLEQNIKIISSRINTDDSDILERLERVKKDLGLLKNVIKDITTSPSKKNSSQESSISKSKTDAYKEKKINGKYTFVSKRIITNRELDNYSKLELEIMRNEVYARHGYIFNDEKMKKYFNSQFWYKGKIDEDGLMMVMTELENNNTNLIKAKEDSFKSFIITVDNLRVRTSPELDSDKIENLPVDTEVEFIEKSTKETTVTIRGKQITAPWYKVKTPSGNIGWIHGCCFSGL